MRLIDADEYKEKLYKMMPKFDEENNKTCIEGQTIFFCIEMLDDMPTITPPPNEPLTLEQLREMDGEPVWVIPLDDFDILPANYLVNAYAEQMVVDKFGAYLDFEDYGKTWLAYRRKLEDGTE